MAEAVAVVASNLLAGISSEAFKMDHSLVGFKQELKKLKETIKSIQAVLLDAEKKQEDSADIKRWIERLGWVMYDADDLFDVTATDSLLKQQMTKAKQVRSYFSRSNPIVYNNSFVKKVKAIRKRLNGLCNDMARFGFVPSSCEKQMSALNQRQDTGSFVHHTAVIGRDDDKNVVLELLLAESHAGQSLSLIAIVGNCGIGKTTLAQLVYNNKEVKKNFERRWWATIYDIYNEKGILGRILGSISMNKSYHSFTISQLYSAIAESLKKGTGKYLLVLDVVGVHDSSMWFRIMSLLRRGTAGSRIIITTRSMQVARDMDAEHIHHLKHLTEEESWELFRMTAFKQEQEYSLVSISLGREIVRRCYGVPLAIKCMASLLSTRNMTEEWMTFTNKKIQSDDSILSILKLSYNQLPITLKRCLAYCALFPEDYVFQKKELTYLWISQGFVMPTSDGKPAEEIGYEYFMELLDRSFFQEAVTDEYGEVLSCKMHGLIHQLVESVDRYESINMRRSEFVQCVFWVRHLSISYEMDSLWNIMFLADQLRSFLCLYEGSLSPLALDDLLAKFKHLRALNLRQQRIEAVPRYIGHLKLLRYLNLSHNKFRHLPDSITMLLNLLTLDISWCEQLELLPDEFRKLCNLRHLDTKKCYRLRHMPPKFEELTSLQCLSFFKVGKSIQASCSRLNILARLKLKGELEIKFDEDRDWYEEEGWQLPLGIRVVTIENYPGMILPHWETTVPSLLPNLVDIFISSSSKIKNISLLRCLPFLETLKLSYLEQLEYIESEERGEQRALLFPSLKALKLEGLPKLKGWWREVEAAVTIRCVATELVTEHSSSCTSLPVLADLTVRCCRKFMSMPLCPCIRTLELNDVSDQLIQLLLTSSDASSSSSSSSAPLSSLENIAIWGCDLQSFGGGDLTSLHHLEFRYCDELKSLYLAPSERNTLEELVIQSCPELELWEDEKRGVNWEFLHKLRKLTVTGMPNPEKLPDSLQKLQAHGNLVINME